MAILPPLMEAKAAILALTRMPYQRSWADELQYIQLKREVAGTSRIEGAEFTEKELKLHCDRRPRSWRHGPNARRLRPWLPIAGSHSYLATNPEVQRSSVKCTAGSSQAATTTIAPRSTPQPRSERHLWHAASPGGRVKRMRRGAAPARRGYARGLPQARSPCPGARAALPPCGAAPLSRR